MFGISTFYKMDSEGDGSIWVKLEGTLAGVPLFEQLAVVREVGLFSEWVPFCNHSTFVRKIGVAELIAHLNILLPCILSRDVCLHAYACDCTYENGSLVILGSSLEEFEGEEMPKLSGFIQDRAIIKGFKVLRFF